MYGKTRISAGALIAVLFFCCSIVSAETLHQQWTDLLHRYVQDGIVDYQGFKEEEKQLDGYLDFLAATDPEPMSSDDQLAFYINA